MKRRNLNIVIAFVFIITLSLSMGSLMAADDIKEWEDVKIVGTINEVDQLIAEDGTIYEIDITDAGNALVEEVGKKVEATGVVEDL
ncbi:MAG: hypothetical protein HQ589_05300, partial [Syntrophaceae bacterium]|nr:hypothetical protein [Syntrophaceae bacterium]